MEVDLLHRYAVGPGLRLSQKAVYRLRLVTHRLRERQFLDQVPDVTGGVVVVLMAMRVVMSVFVMMVMFVFMWMVVALVAVLLADGVDQTAVALLQTVDHYPHVGAGNALAADVLCRYCEARKEVVHGVEKLLLFRVQLVEGSHQHISRCAHGALQVQCFHASSTPFIWLIREARKPAPKPLSMFTTLMPLAQEFSIASKAARPPRLAP